MENTISNYKGYEIVSLHNKKIVAQIENNKHRCEHNKELFYVPSIRFMFKNYNSMVSFMDENPK